MSGTSVATRLPSPSSRAIADRRAHGDARGGTGKDGFLARQPQRHGDRVAVCDGDHGVRPGAGMSQSSRSSMMPSTSVPPYSPAHAPRSGIAPTIRIYGSRSRRKRAVPASVPPLPTHATNASRRAVAVGEDLGPGRVVVRARVRRIFELVGQVRAPLASERLRAPDVALRVRRLDVGTRMDHLCAESTKHELLVVRGALRHDDDAAVTAHRTDDGQSHSGIAGARFHDRRPGLQLTALLRVGDHRQGGAIFDATAWRKELELRDHLGAARRHDASQAY